MTPSPVRVFIGTDDTQAVPTAVLKHSILSRTDAAVEFTELCNLQTGLEDRFYTGFSFYRWGIPAFCDFAGRALYLDADIVVLCDIRELWDMPLGNRSHLCRPRPPFRFRRWAIERLGGAYASVMVIDCERARHWDFDTWCERAADDRQFYREVMWCLPGSATADRRGDLPRAFNDLDRFAPGPDEDHPLHRPAQPAVEEDGTSLRARVPAGVAGRLRGRRRSTSRPCGRTWRGGVIHDQMIRWCAEDPDQS